MQHSAGSESFPEEVPVYPSIGGGIGNAVDGIRLDRGEPVDRFYVGAELGQDFNQACVEARPRIDGNAERHLLAESREGPRCSDDGRPGNIPGLFAKRPGRRPIVRLGVHAQEP